MRKYEDIEEAYFYAMRAADEANCRSWVEHDSDKNEVYQMGDYDGETVVINTYPYHDKAKKGGA